QKRPTQRVTCVSCGAGGSRLLRATAGEVWGGDAPFPNPPLELVGHTAKPVVFSPDGSRIATGSSDGTVKVWDVKTGATLLELKGHTGAAVDGLVHIWHVAFSADGTRIVSSDETTVKVWDAKTGSALVELKAKSDRILMVAVSPDGTRIVTAGSRREGNSIRGVATVWDALAGTPLVELSEFPLIVDAISFSPDGTRFFTYLTGGTVQAWDTRTGKEVPGAAIPPMNRNERISPDGRLFAYLKDDRVELISLVPDAEEIAYRRLDRAPDVRRYRASYLAAGAAKADFAARFYLDRLIEFFTTTNQPDEAKKWRTEWEKYPEVAPPPREDK